MNFLSNRGQSLLEVLIAAGIFILVSTAALFIFFGGQSLSVDSTNANIALEYAREGLEAARAIRNRDWTEVTVGTHGLEFSGNQWQLSGSQNSKDIFTREVVITEVATNTKKIIVTVSWQPDPSRPQSISLTEQLTNWSGVLVGGCATDPLSGDWTNPQTLGSADLGAGNEGTDLVVSLPYLYVGGKAASVGKPDVFVFDVSDTANPTEIDNINIGAGGVNALYLNGNYLYGASANNSKELVVFDISDPANISEIGSLDLDGDEDALSIHGIENTVYLGREEDGDGDELFVIDITTPSSPVITTSFNIEDDVNDIFATKEKLYLVSEKSDKDLWIYDLAADPNSPTLLDTHDLSVGGELNAVHIQPPGNVLTGDTSNTFFVLGATTTSQIYVRDSINVGGSINDIACVAGNLAFLATSNSGKEFVIIDISDPTNIIEYSSLNYPQVGTGMDYAENKVFMSVRSNDAVRIIGPGP